MSGSHLACAIYYLLLEMSTPTAAAQVGLWCWTRHRQLRSACYVIPDTGSSGLLVMPDPTPAAQIGLWCRTRHRQLRPACDVRPDTASLGRHVISDPTRELRSACDVGPDIASSGLHVMSDPTARAHVCMWCRTQHLKLRSVWAAPQHISQIICIQVFLIYR